MCHFVGAEHPATAEAQFLPLRLQGGHVVLVL